MMLPREQALRSLVESAMVQSGGSESTIGRILDFLEDLDGAVTFMTGWQRGAVLGLEPDERLDRWGMTVRISERADCDADFRRELLRHPRYLSAIAIREGLGIKPIDYLWQVNAVRVVEEEPGLHWLILPACHLGCGTPEVLASPPLNGSCQVCGKPQGQTSGCQRVTSSLATPADRIHEIDEFIVRSVQADLSARARLMANPTDFFVGASQAVFGVRPQEEFGIREVKVAADTPTSLCLVLLARHEPQCSAANSCEGMEVSDMRCLTRRHTWQTPETDRRRRA